MAMFKLECFTQAFAMIKFFSVFPRGINTETPSLAETNDAAKLLRKSEWCKFSNAPFCAGAEWRTMAHFLEVFFWIFPKMIIFSRFSPRRFTSQGTTAPQVRGQPIAMSEKSSNFAAQFKITARSSHVHRIITAHACTCKQQANKVFPEDASRVLKLWTRLFKIKQDFF